jgi:hypothetical protein
MALLLIGWGGVSAGPLTDRSNGWPSWLVEGLPVSRSVWLRDVGAALASTGGSVAAGGTQPVWSGWTDP